MTNSRSAANALFRTFIVLVVALIVCPPLSRAFKRFGSCMYCQTAPAADSGSVIQAGEPIAAPDTSITCTKAQLDSLALEQMLLALPDSTRDSAKNRCEIAAPASRAR